MPLIVASISDYANKYVEDWASENGVDKNVALDEILTSIRKDTERDE